MFRQEEIQPITASPKKFPGVYRQVVKMGKISGCFGILGQQLKGK
jgi:hypothetical protein